MTTVDPIAHFPQRMSSSSRKVNCRECLALGGKRKGSIPIIEAKSIQFIGFLNGDPDGYNETIEGKSGDTSALKKAPKKQIIDCLSHEFIVLRQ